VSRKTPPPPRSELQPYERQLWPGAPHRLRGVAHLDDEHPAWIQVPRRLTQDDADRVEPIATGSERKLRLMPVLRGQGEQLGFPYVWRIGDDNIVARVFQGPEMVRTHQAHPSCQAMAPQVFARDLERFRGDIERIDARLAQVVRAGDRDTPGTGADIEHPPDARGIHPGGKAALDQLGER
jgi:hypothetical protein